MRVALASMSSTASGPSSQKNVQEATAMPDALSPHSGVATGTSCTVPANMCSI